MREMPRPPKKTQADLALASKAIDALSLPKEAMIKEKAKMRAEVEAEKANHRQH